MLIAALNRRDWGSETKELVAALLCFLVAIPVVYAQGFIDATDWLRTGLIIFFVAIFTYKLFWQPSQIAPNVERATG